MNRVKFICIAIMAGAVGAAVSEYRNMKPKAAKPVISKSVETPPAHTEAPVNSAVPFVEAVPLPLTPKIDRVATLDGKDRIVSEALSKCAQNTADWMLDNYKGKDALAHTEFPKWFLDKHGVTRENVAWGATGYDWPDIYPIWHGSRPHEYNWQHGGRYIGYGKSKPAANGVCYFVVIYAEKP
jgi:hypothetical protein